jgi:hypothetical protein
MAPVARRSIMNDFRNALGARTTMLCATTMLAIACGLASLPAFAQKTPGVSPGSSTLMNDQSLLKNLIKPTVPKVKLQNQNLMKPLGTGSGMRRIDGPDENRLRSTGTPTAVGKPAATATDRKSKSKRSKSAGGKVKGVKTGVADGLSKKAATVPGATLGIAPKGKRIDTLRGKVGVESLDAAKGAAGVKAGALGTSDDGRGLPKTPGTPGSAGPAMTLGHPGGKASDNSDPMDGLRIGHHSDNARTFIEERGGGGVDRSVTTEEEGGSTFRFVETRWSDGQGHQHTVRQSYRDGEGPGGWTHTEISVDENGQQRYSHNEFGADGRQRSAERVVYNSDGSVRSRMRGRDDGSMEVLTLHGVATGSDNVGMGAKNTESNRPTGPAQNTISGQGGNTTTSATMNTPTNQGGRSASSSGNTTSSSDTGNTVSSSGNTTSSSGNTTSSGDKPAGDKSASADKPEKADKPDKGTSQPVEGGGSNRDFFGERGVTHPGGRPKEARRGPYVGPAPDPSGVVIRRDNTRTPEEIKAMVTQPGVDGEVSGGGGGGSSGPAVSRFAQPADPNSLGQGGSVIASPPGIGGLGGSDAPAGLVNPGGKVR